MSSSRRLVYTWFREDSEELGGPSSKWRKEMTHLQQMFDKYGIEISDVTSNLEQGCGNLARPCQIKAWLVDKINVSNFVILDNEPWVWSWLSDYVVRTDRPHTTKESKKLYGLQDEDIEKAIAILNEEREHYWN